MNKIEIVNENGYRALRNLADKRPRLFTTPNTDMLRKEMVREAGTEDVVKDTISMRCSLDPLNEVDRAGPNTDYYYSKIVRRALADISPADVADELFWASINCFAIADYVPMRWGTSNTRKTNPEEFVDRHWLKGGPDGREANAAARLWWLGEISERVAGYSTHSADKLLWAMANNVNLYHQTLARRYLLANPRLVAAIYEIAMDGNDYLYQTAYANQMFKSLNIRAGATALDMMDNDELRAVVEEAKPPKG